MVTSMPPPVSKLGLSLEDYFNIAKNIGIVSLLSKDARQKILDRANEELSAELRRKSKPLIEKMAYDRQVYEIAGLNYAKGPPEGEGLFITAVADYLLRNK